MNQSIGTAGSTWTVRACWILAWASFAVCEPHIGAAELGSLQRTLVISRDPTNNCPISHLACGKLLELRFAPSTTGVRCVLQPIGQDPRLPSAAVTNELMSPRAAFWALGFSGYSPERDDQFPLCAAFDTERSTLVLCMCNLTGETRWVPFDLKPLRHTFTQMRTTTLLSGGRNRDAFKELDIRVDGIFHVTAPKDSVVLVILEDWVRDEPPARRPNPANSPNSLRPRQTK